MAIGLMALVIVASATAQRPETLREALQRAGIAIPSALPPSDLDRRWTSSDADHDDTRLVAAIFFKDEMLDERHLGAMHLVEVTKSGEVWRRLMREDDPTIETGGSVRGVSVYRDFSVVATHISPSAGYLLVADRGLQRISSLWGFGHFVLPDGTLLYRGSMVHFAQVRQNTLHAFNPATATKVEVFPGPFKSIYEQRTKRALADILGRLSSAERNELDLFPESGGDRDFNDWRVSDDGRRVALAVTYGHDTLMYGKKIPVDDAWPAFMFRTIVRCDRNRDEWQCREELLETAANRLKVDVPDEYPGRDRALERLLDLALREP